MSNTNVNENPLKNYLRTPKTYVVLPSQGKFSKLKTQSEITGEIPIFPMTAKDEIMLRNPDALLNGESLVSVIKSVTGIEDVYNLAANDIDVILLACRYATYGNELEVETTCQKCNHEFTLNVNIEAILSTIVELKDEYIVDLPNGLKIYLRPYTFKDNQLIALQAFRETNALNKLTDENSKVDEMQQLLTFNRSFQALADLNIKILANSIIKIIIPRDINDENSIETTVKEPEHIHDWVKSISREEAEEITKVAEEVNQEGIKRDFEVTCEKEECDHTYKQKLEFNPASFFDTGS